MTNCLNCNKDLTNIPRKHRFCSQSCCHDYHNRYYKRKLKYYKFLLSYILKNKTHFGIQELTINYYESIHGNNLKYSIRNDILKKYKLGFIGIIGFLSRNNMIEKLYSTLRTNRYIVNDLLIRNIKKIINTNFKGKKNKRTMDIDNLDWIPFNQLEYESLYFLCNPEFSEVDNNFKRLYNLE